VKKLIQGIIEFRKNVRAEYREKFAKLALGQKPDALLIACSDSRVAVNVFASTEPGDLFVIRNPGNLIAPCGKDGRSINDDAEAGAIEFATLVLNVTDIIVCGHSECGAMRMLLGELQDLPAPHLKDWLKHAQKALAQLKRGKGGEDLAPHNRLSQLNVLHQIENLRTYPIVSERLKAGRLRLHGWWFDIAQAEVLAYDEKARKFVVVDEAEAERHLELLDDDKDTSVAPKPPA
jgi:carbonic anhydrase